MYDIDKQVPVHDKITCSLFDKYAPFTRSIRRPTITWTEDIKNTKRATTQGQCR